MSDNALARYAIDYGGQPAWVDPYDPYDRLGLRPVYRQEGDAEPMGYTGGGPRAPEVARHAWRHRLKELDDPRNYMSDLTRNMNALARHRAREREMYPDRVFGAPEYDVDRPRSFHGMLLDVDDSAGRGVRAPFRPSDEVPNAGRVMTPGELMYQMMPDYPPPRLRPFR